LTVCNKYGVDPEPEYVIAKASDEEKLLWKYAAAEEAIASTIASAEKGGIQWAKSGRDGKREFVDFNKVHFFFFSFSNFQLIVIT